MTRIIVSGLGVVSSCGITLDSFWEHLVAGQGNFLDAELAPGTRFLVGAVTDTSHSQGLPLDSLALCDRSGIFAVSAAVRALKDAELSGPFERPDRVAVVLGNGASGQTSIEEQYRRLFIDGKKKTHPFSVVRSMGSASASWVSIAVGAQGPCFVTSSACASASHAIGIAASLIKSGAADVAITGGTEACLTLGTILAWDSMKMMSRSACRPFARGRDGLVISEGAGVVILESEAHARGRGYDGVIELAGFGSNADAREIVSPSIEGMVGAMRNALASAEMLPENVDYVNAHGTATRANDISETNAMKRLFRIGCPPLSSTKSVTGHALGAAGALEAIATVLSMRHGVAPPTANYDEADPECDLDYVPNEARDLKINAALSNSFGFGGLNAALAFRRII